MSADRRQFLGAMAGTAVIPPRQFGGVYVHTWAEKLVPLPAGGYGTETIQVSEGPFDAADADSRMREIGTKGLQIGPHYFPVHRVHLVELRSGR